MMKIYLVNRFFYPDISATSQMLTDAAHYLADQENIEVHVVTSRLMYEGRELLAPRESVGKVQVHRIWTTSFGRGGMFGRAADYLSFYFSVFFFLLAHLNPGDLALAKTDPPLVSVPVSWAAWLKGAVLVNWLQDLFPEVAEQLGIKIPTPVLAVIRWFRDRSLFQARVNIVIGEMMRERVLGCGVAADEAVVIPNWAGDNIRPRTRSAVPTGTVDLLMMTLKSSMCSAIDFATLSTYCRSAEPSSSGGVPTAIKIASASSRPSAKVLVKSRCLLLWLLSTKGSSLGS